MACDPGSQRFNRRLHKPWRFNEGFGEPPRFYLPRVGWNDAGIGRAAEWIRTALPILLSRYYEHSHRACGCCEQP